MKLKRTELRNMTKARALSILKYDSTQLDCVDIDELLDHVRRCEDREIFELQASQCESADEYLANFSQVSLRSGRVVVDRWIV